MPRDKMLSNPGSAEVKHTGHTASNQHGSNPNMQVRGRSEPRRLKAK